jgi:hypothetical protein
MVDMGQGRQYEACTLTSSGGLYLCTGSSIYILGWTLLLPGAAASVLGSAFWGYRHR